MSGDVELVSGRLRFTTVLSIGVRCKEAEIVDRRYRVVAACAHCFRRVQSQVSHGSEASSSSNPIHN